MPHKFNTSRRHKFAKKKYRVTNWCGYNESLRNRGDLTVWITGDARKHWAAPRRRSRGGQPRYSDLAITMCLTLGMVYRLPLRQTQGLIRSISKLMLLGRWKAIIGPKLKARCFENQQTEAKIGIAILNKMTELDRPVFKQIS